MFLFFLSFFIIFVSSLLLFFIILIILCFIVIVFFLPNVSTHIFPALLEEGRKDATRVGMEMSDAASALVDTWG